PSNFWAMKKYNIKLIASTMVVINGPAIMAGSSFSFLASNGKVPPTILAVITVTIVVTDTVKAIIKSTLSIKISLMKLTVERAAPTIELILNSFHNTFNQSLVVISPTAKPLMIKV